MKSCTELEEYCVKLEPMTQPFTHQRDTVISIHRNPDFELTFEEEFKIHELEVRKENMLDTMLSLMIELTNFKDKFANFARSMPKCPIDTLCLEDMARIKKEMMGNIAHGGSIRQCLEMYDEQKKVDHGVKSETFMFSIAVNMLCVR